jgi:hypothetical protein
MPVVILLIPAMAHFFSEKVELFLVLSIVPISLAGFIPVWMKHRSYKLLRIFAISLILILVSQIFLHNDLMLPDEANTFTMSSLSTTLFRGLVMFTGAFGLAYSMYKVKKHTHVCKHPGHHHHHHDHEIN